MNERCNFADNCPMFKYFSRIAELMYRMAYCEGDYEACARRKMRLSGNNVPENLGPQGAKLWADGATPPEFQLPGM